MVKLLLAGFLAAHGLIHASFLSPTPPATAEGPPWPFEMAKSWLVTQAGLNAGQVSVVGTVLVALTVTGFGLAALGAAGWIVPAELWRPLIVGSVAASTLLLALFFHPFLLLGFLIDAVIVWAVFVLSWNPLLGTD
jgi:hypothetical protein